jgi:hypothetical protein
MNPEERVRSRKSYTLWSDLALFLKKRPGVGKTLWRLFWLLDNSKAFGTEQAAFYAHQSLVLFCKDNCLRPIEEENPYKRKTSD